MTKKILKLVNCFFLLLVIAVSQKVFAYTPDITDPRYTGMLWPERGFNTVAGAAQLILNTLLGLAGALAVLAIIYSGVMYITAGPDTDKASTARKNLTWAIIGIVVILLLGLIINTVIDIFSGVAPPRFETR